LSRQRLRLIEKHEHRQYNYTGLLSTTSNISLAQSDHRDNTVATSGFYLNTFMLITSNNGNKGVISQ
jgi:hypothetical protein